jgi:uncharacterized membrane protein
VRNKLKATMRALIKRLKSKTYWAAIVGATLVVVEQNSGILSAYLPESIRTMAVLLWPVIMVALREVTTKPVSAK